jgi:hypothetical protein
MSGSVDGLLEQDMRNLNLGLRERKREREVIGDGSVDLSRNVGINRAEFVDAEVVDRKEGERRNVDNIPG